MKRLFLHLPAIVIGLLAGWLISTRISPRETAPPTAAAAVVIAKPALPAANAADFAKLVSRPLRSVGCYDLRGIAKSTELFTPVGE